MDRFCGSFKLFSADGMPLRHDKCWMALALRHDKTYAGQEIVVERPDGSRRTVLAHASPIHDRSGCLLGAVNVLVDISDRQEVEALRGARAEAETLNELARVLAAELDLQKLVQRVTDAATEMTRANFGAFFYNVVDTQGEAYLLYALSGAPREAFERFGIPRNTELFEPTFRGAGVVRIDDVTKDPRYGKNAPHHGMPKGHLPVRSYLAMSVVSRSGEVLGGLFLGHPEPGVFRQCDERMIIGLAAQAAIAIDNARLYAKAQQEIEQRKLAEAAAHENDAYLRLVLDSSNAGFYAVDKDGTTTLCNAAFMRMLGFERADDAVGRQLHDVIHHSHCDGSHYPKEECRIYRTAATGCPAHVDDELFFRLDGSSFPVEYWSYPIVRDGELRGAITTFVDISERKQAEQALRHAEQELRDADRRKDEFLATLAHELRNPLAPMQNVVQALRLKKPSDRELRWGQDVLDRQLQQLTRLVDDLLDLARIAKGKIELRRERVPISAVVAASLETSRPWIDAGGHELAVALPAEPLFVDADLTRLAQVLANLLNNAAKYTERGGRIALAVDSHDAEVVLRVRDNGIGIPVRMLSRIFDMFTQTAHPLTRTQGGLGIGLTLARRLVEMHGGHIEAFSEGHGKGSEFAIRLPLAVNVPEMLDAPRRAAMTSPSSPRRILVVDDNRDAADSLAMLLHMQGHEVSVANDGLEALEKAAAARPEVVFLDIGMPKLNGYETARRIREQPWGASVTLVALTGWGHDDDKRRAVEAGFHHHLTKPVDPVGLAKVLSS